MRVKRIPILPKSYYLAHGYDIVFAHPITDRGLARILKGLVQDWKDKREDKLFKELGI